MKTETSTLLWYGAAGLLSILGGLLVAAGLGVWVVAAFCACALAFTVVKRNWRARVLCAAGILALVLILWFGILALSARVGAGQMAFALAAIVHSIFEGWLLSPVGPMLLVFSALWTASARATQESKTPSARSPLSRESFP